jgi:hypothetical protein
MPHAIDHILLLAFCKLLLFGFTLELLGTLRCDSSGSSVIGYVDGCGGWRRGRVIFERRRELRNVRRSGGYRGRNSGPRTEH